MHNLTKDELFVLGNIFMACEAEAGWAGTT
ncbi:hypothetical protein DmGdi_20850 [Gluconobacter sp. Gdi]|nr:hypothetical protein DmGdi_20850 [Gluconobacter sp. Gdi]